MWMAVIFWFSANSHDASTSQSDTIIGLIPYATSWPQEVATLLVRKAAHIFIYFVLGLLMLNAAKDAVLSNKRAILLSVLFVMLYAISDEIHQVFVPGRGPQVTDVLIDTVAGAVGILIYYFVGKTKLLKRPK